MIFKDKFHVYPPFPRRRQGIITAISGKNQAPHKVFQAARWHRLLTSNAIQPITNEEVMGQSTDIGRNACGSIDIDAYRVVATQLRREVMRDAVPSEGIRSVLATAVVLDRASMLGARPHPDATTSPSARAVSMPSTEPERAWPAWADLPLLALLVGWLRSTDRAGVAGTTDMPRTHRACWADGNDLKATLTGHASPLSWQARLLSRTAFDTGLVRRSVRRYVSANAPRGVGLCISRMVVGHPVISTKARGR